MLRDAMMLIIVVLQDGIIIAKYEGKIYGKDIIEELCFEIFVVIYVYESY